ncbi:hypothetical protein ARALYDRAFT_315689 [Arabidopsis lyrata subsp. lyrata]|uniref:Uncharacterized protein n=1 Tax=Arabidopsis lyrata subsp. lyrata TaxID=81972 RepID=D7KUA0_ARALL|nr:hypothetical protein ARALYDRAFT_315689 [Arabidopsis lyrata subsp. lyrata]
MPPSSATPPRRGWWSRPIATFPNDRKPTVREGTALLTPMYLSVITLIIVYFINQDPYQAKFTIQSIAVSPSTATWHVDFLVTNPSSIPLFYLLIYYGGDTAVRLGSLNAAVLNTSHKSYSPSQTVFSVDFVVEDHPNDVVYEQLDIKLKAKDDSYRGDIAGHIDIRCRNLTQIHENVEKIQCHSSFTELKTLKLFANSVSVTNVDIKANISAADWRIGFAANSPVTGCKISILTLSSRLLRGEQVISNSSSWENLGEFVPRDKTNIVFEKVVMPKLIGDMIWNLRVKIMYAVKTDARYINGLLMADCPDIPVKFTTDAAGKVMGTLLGNVRRCEYKFQHDLDYSVLNSY